MYLGSIRSLLDKLEPEEIFPYAPTQGLEPLRELVEAGASQEEPRSRGRFVLAPRSWCRADRRHRDLADLFAGPGVPVVLPDLQWTTTRSCSRPGARRGSSRSRSIRRRRLQRRGHGGGAPRRGARGPGDPAAELPQQPDRVLPDEGEAEAIVAAVREAARSGTRILAITDERVLGCSTSPETFTQSCSPGSAGSTERVLARRSTGPPRRTSPGASAPGLSARRREGARATRTTSAHPQS